MDDFLSIVSLIFKGSWRLLTGVTIPGTDMSFAVVLCGAALVTFGFRVLRVILSVSFGGSLNSKKE